ncbi:unnamed protein product [Euphydryas editha]|nr:unnamed protein product [Euphydryas editha]
MQPLDTCVYGPFKNYFEQEVSLFQRTHVGRIISQYDVAKLFGEAYIKAASAQNAVKEFSTTRIWPTNRNVFNDSDYMPSTVTDRPETTHDPDVNEQRQTVDVTNASNANIMEMANIILWNGKRKKLTKHVTKKNLNKDKPSTSMKRQKKKTKRGPKKI